MTEQQNWKKEHWIDNPRAWEKWKMEQGKIKKEQRKKEKGAKGRESEKSREQGGKCERSRGQGPPLTEAHY